MTANEVFALATSLIFERAGEDQDTQYFTPAFLTIALQETLPYENSWRKNHCLPVIEAPTVTDLEAELPYTDPYLLKVAIPYALASQYYRDNNDQYHEQYYRNLYIMACSDGAPYVIDKVIDIYADYRD